MRENRINWPQFFRPVCVLCMVCGGLWLWWQMSLTENLLGLSLIHISEPTSRS